MMHNLQLFHISKMMMRCSSIHLYLQSCIPPPLAAYYIVMMMSHEQVMCHHI